MSEINGRTLSELRSLLAGGALSAVEIVEASLERIEQWDGSLGCFLHLLADEARGEARASDQRRQRHKERGPLDGLPLALKDNLLLAHVPTTCASRILEGYLPPFTATAVERLKQAGAIFLGKLNMDEFAMGSSTENSALAPCRNPWDLSRSPGGSSGGAAAAVAASLCAAALGSDTGGSLRQPAAFCGVTALLPTYGRVSRYGLIAFASSLDQIGPLAHNVEDCALLLSAIAGYDERDATSSPRPVPPYLNLLQAPLHKLRSSPSSVSAPSPSAPLKGLRLGVPRLWSIDNDPPGEWLFVAGPDQERAPSTDRDPQREGPKSRSSPEKPPQEKPRQGKTLQENSPGGDLAPGKPRQGNDPGGDLACLSPDVAHLFDEALRDLCDLGAEIEEVTLPHAPYALATYTILATAEAASNLARYDGVRYGYRAAASPDSLSPHPGHSQSQRVAQPRASERSEPLSLDLLYERSRTEGFGPEVRRRLLLGTCVLSQGYHQDFYARAQEVRALLRQDFARAFERCDLLLTPTSPTAAFPLGQRFGDSLQMLRSDLLTVPANLAGLPALSLPCGFQQECLPVGLQLLAPPFAETLLLQTGYAYQQATSWHKQTPNRLKRE